MQDDGYILFPSITVCKDRMYTAYPDYLEPFFKENISDSSINFEDVQSWVLKHTWRRSKMFQILHHKTSGLAHYPCDTISGDKIGKPCSFPFLFPDCSVQYVKTQI